jgi:hypothetical protein
MKKKKYIKIGSFGANYSCQKIFSVPDITLYIIIIKVSKKRDKNIQIYIVCKVVLFTITELKMCHRFIDDL